MIKVLFLILLSSNLAELKAVERVFLDPGIDPLSDEMVNAINSLNTTWKAKRNFVGVSLDYVRGLMGVIPDDDVSLIPELDIQIAEFIPERFDARERWPYCSSLFNIQDQGACGSCWAFNAAAAMSDRICIASGGKFQVQLSAQDVLACTPKIFKDQPKNGCDGGSPFAAWEYWEFSGIVTSGCQPYKYESCNHSTEGFTLPYCSMLKVKEPVCEKICQKNYTESYEKDKYYGKKSGLVGKSYSGLTRIQKIQSEIMANGSVQASLFPYTDFFNYAGGVYEPVLGEKEEEHAVRLIGWGVEGNKDYWLAANSWNAKWGNDKGYFKILRGNNTCEIESKVYAGTPVLPDN